MKRATVDLTELLEGVLGPRPGGAPKLTPDQPRELTPDQPRRSRRAEPREPAPGELRRQRKARKGAERLKRRRANRAARVELEAAGALPRSAPLPSRQTERWWPYMLRETLKDITAARKPIDFKTASTEQLAAFYVTRETLMRRVDLRVRALLRTLELET